MNLRNILRAYTLLRQLTNDESALLETLRGLNDAERESLVVVLQPGKTATKRASKKSSKAGSKSPRASSLAQQIKRATDDGEKPSRVLCAACSNDEDFADHFKPSPHYHEFDAGKSPTSTAQPARGKSSTNGGATTTIPNSVDGTDDVSSAHHAGG